MDCHLHMDCSLGRGRRRVLDEDWVRDVSKDIAKLSHIETSIAEISQASSANAATPSLKLPDEPSYKRKIGRCHDEIRAGNSYELCLTNQATIATNRSSRKDYRDVIVKEKIK